MFRSITLPNTIKGKLFLHSMPGRFESWKKFEEYARIANLDLIICLTPTEEIDIYSPDYAHAIQAKSLPCFRVQYAIEDYSIPQEKVNFAKLVRSVAARINAGDAVLVHCFAGYGRTGLFASCILKQLGLQYEQLSELIEEAGSGVASLEEIESYF